MCYVDAKPIAAHTVRSTLSISTTEDGCTTANTTGNTDDDLSLYNNLVNDGVSDTPSHLRPTDEYPGYETCWRDAALDTCDDSIPGIDVGMDPIDNCMYDTSGTV